MKRSVLWWAGLIIGAQAIVWGGFYAIDQLAYSHAAGKQAPFNQPDDVPRRTIHDMHRAQRANPPALVIDVRREQAYADGHIPGSIRVSTSGLQAWASQQPAAAKKRPIYLYCACTAEHSAAVGAVTLNRMGFDAVYAVEGGWTAWQKAKLPIEKGASPTDEGASPAGKGGSTPAKGAAH